MCVAEQTGWRNGTLIHLPPLLVFLPHISPYPYPVQWWEYFIIVAIVVAFSVVMEAYVNELLVRNFMAALRWVSGMTMPERQSKEGDTVLSVVQSIIHDLTYADVTSATGLVEAGLSSMTTIIFVSEIKKFYKTLKLTVRDVSQSETVGELVDLIEGRMMESAARPELALGKRTAVGAPNDMKKREESSDFAERSLDGGASHASSHLLAAHQGVSARSGEDATHACSLLRIFLIFCWQQLMLFCAGAGMDGMAHNRRSSIRPRRASIVLGEPGGYNESRRRRPSARSTSISSGSATAYRSNSAAGLTFRMQTPNETNNTSRRRISSRSGMGHRASILSTASSRHGGLPNRGISSRLVVP